MLRHVIKLTAAFSVALLVTILVAMPVMAAEIRFQENTVTIGSGEVIDDDLYAVGNKVIIDGVVNGDVLTACETITVNGKVNGSIIGVASTVNVNGEVTHAVRVVGGNINISGNIGGDLVAAGGQINVISTAKIGRDLVFGGGTIVIDGLIGDDIKGGGGEITINNGVGGNVELGVESLVIGSTANIRGNLVYVSEKEANIQSGAQIGGTTTHRVPEVKEPVIPKIGIWSKVIAFLMTLITGIVIILIVPRRAIAVADSIRHKPWLSLGWGAVILFATPVAVIVTFITVIGLPVGLIGLTLYGLAIYLSQIAVGLFIGYLIIGSFSEVESRGILIGALSLGFAILTLLKLIPYVGFAMWLAAALFGIGAIVLSEKMLRAEVQ